MFDGLRNKKYIKFQTIFYTIVLCKSKNRVKTRPRPKIGNFFNDKIYLVLQILELSGSVKCVFEIKLMAQSIFNIDINIILVILRSF